MIKEMLHQDLRSKGKRYKKDDI